MRRVLALVVLGLIAVTLTATPAWAHAVLQETSPSDRSVLDAAPEVVSLRFNEPVTLPSGGLRVFDAGANRVDEGSIDVGGPETVGAALPDDLPEGGYIVTWRVVSADSHPVSGVVTFTVGDAPPVDEALVAELFAGGAGIAGTIGPALRAITYVAVLIGVGAVYAMSFLVRRRPDLRIARRLGFLGALTGIVATLAAVPVQAAAVSGGGPFAVVNAAVLTEVFGSSFGQGTVVRLVWLTVLLVFLAWRVQAVPRLVVATAAVLSFLLDGHQRSQEPGWLLLTADAVHLTAGALWFGGLVLLVWLVRRRGIEDDPVDAARLVARFSSAALVSFVAVSLAGTAMAWALVRAPRALTETTYGWVLIAKVALVVLVVLVAAYNRQRLVPAIAARAVPAGGSSDAPSTEGLVADPDGPDADVADPAASDPDAAARGESPQEPATVRRSQAAWRQLRTTLRIEVALLVAVLGLTGALVTIQPAAQAAGVTGAAFVSAPLTDDLDVDVIVDPNEVGVNALHIFVLDETGRPAADVDDLVLDLTFVPEDIGPFRVEPFFVGPGHWTANVDTLRFAGEWRIEVTAGLDRFTEARASVSIVVNR